MSLSELRHIAQVQRRLREVLRCKDCGKCVDILSVPKGRAFVPETVTLETHCSCPGGPAEQLAVAVASAKAVQP